MAYTTPDTNRVNPFVVDHFEPVLRAPATSAVVEDEERRRFCVVQAVASKDETQEVVTLAASIYEWIKGAKP